MAPIGTALIGFGLGGRAFHAPYVSSDGQFDFLAVVSRDAAKVHAQYPEVQVVPTVEDMLALPGVELVVVSSPDHLHVDHALAAIAAGKHVVIDKPLATNMSEARRIRDAAITSGKVITAFQNRRWDADFLTLQDLIKSGKLGRIVHFESHFDRWRPLDASSWKEARGGGSWQDLGPHLIDQAIVLFGLPQAVTADIAALREGAPAPDWFHVILHYSDMRVTLHSSKQAADNSLRFAVHGTKGSWVKQGLDVQELQALAGLSPSSPAFGIDPTEGQFTRAGQVGDQKSVANCQGEYRLFWHALAKAIRYGEANPVPVDQAMQTMAILAVAQTSSQQACTIRLAPADCA